MSDVMHTVGDYKVGLLSNKVYDGGNVVGNLYAPWKVLKSKRITHLFIKLTTEENYHSKNLIRMKQ